MRSFRFQPVLLALTLTMVVGSLALVGTPAAFSQITSAAIHGTVTDSSGAVLPGASVTALNTSTGISTESTANKSGYFLFPDLQVGGPYTVTVSAPGFENFVASGLTLNVNDNREVLATMKVGGTAQTVQVTATAMQVETSNTQLQQTITSDQLENVPMEGRDAAGLQKFEPGVMESSDRFGTYSSNGNQTPQNDVIVDGADDNDGALQDEGIEVNPDALQEENIVTSTMNPEFSRNSGAVIVEVVKAGTNSFHGSGFEYYRDTFMNNANYFSPVDPTTNQKIRPIFHQNLYGGTLGGPIVRNRLFLFAAYQGDRNTTSTTSATSTFSGTNGTSPTGNYAGDFSADENYQTGSNSAGLSGNPIPFNIGSCAAGTPWNVCFPTASVMIPTSEWDPIAKNLINKYVLPSNSSSGLYQFNAGNTGASDQGILRADFTLSPRDTFWGSTIFQSNPSTNDLSFGGGTFPGFGQHASSHFKLFNGSYTHTFSSTMLNELHGNYYRFNFPSVIPTPVQDPSSLGFQIHPQLAQAGIPYMAVGGFFDLGNSYEGPQPRLDTNLTYADNFTWIRGNHSLKIGALYEQFRVHNPFGYLNNGYYFYVGGLEGGGLYSSGDPLLDFAMGIPDGYEQTNDGFIDAVSSETFAYFQDNWKVSPDFTFNYGTAWDVEEPTQDRQYDGLGIDCFSISNTTSKVFPGGPPGLTFKGDPGCNQAGGPTTHWDRFGPRIGFAWSPSEGPSALIGNAGDHAFSIRAAFGLYYNRDQEEQSLQNLLDPPSLLENTGAQEAICTTGPNAGLPCNPGFDNPFQDVAGNGGSANPFPFTTPAPGSAVPWVADGYYFNTLNAFAKSYVPPYTYNYNLNIQRQLGSHYLLQVGYVGSVSHRLQSWYEGDPITPAGHAACLANPGCSSNPGSIHLFYPQYTAQPAIAPGSGGYPWYGSVGEQASEGTSNYNSLQASLRKAMSNGLAFSLAYTYSHALDDGSGYESTTGSGSSAYGNAGRAITYVPGYQYLNYGSSDFDARHRLAATYVYSVPAAGFLRNNAFMREALAGWGISGVTALQTGFPIGLSTGLDKSLWCDGASKFDCLDNPNTSSFKIARYNARTIRTPASGEQTGVAGNYYFDTAPFSEEAVGTFGNTTRNFFRGPGFNYTNLSVTKSFAFSADATRYVQLRLEGFNVFNHANFAPPSGQLTNPTFGQVTGVIESAEGNGDPSPARAVQLAGKFYF